MFHHVASFLDDHVKSLHQLATCWFDCRVKTEDFYSFTVFTADTVKSKNFTNLKREDSYISEGFFKNKNKL